MTTSLRLIIFFAFSLSILTGCSVSKNPLREKVKQLYSGEIIDDSSYVYALPFDSGKSFRVIQGYFSRFSHKERAALDFNMKCGTTICAARGGIVIRVKQDGNKGGLNKKFRKFGNNIVIQHEDGSRAGYWHLQFNGALVKVGDTVSKGEPIALSGKTGYALLPHLHFLAWTYHNNQWQQVPTRFQTSKGIIYLRARKKYRNPGTVSTL
ncbi:MAG: M23 family metallopeptidase [Ferruginibacter sp.]